MQSENLPTALRRSSRVPAELAIRVTSLAGARFSEVCKTLVVNAHGCALQTPVKFDTGIPLRFHSDDGREATARVVSCQPLGADNRSWKMAAKLDRPENFWGLTNCPGDWSLTSAPISIGQVRIVPRATTQQAPSQIDLNLESKLDLVAQRLEAPLRHLIAESLGPLEAQLAVLREIVARREANPSRFDVSLSSIPPQLEQQLEERLRKHLQPIVLHESRQQYADVLEAARSSIDKRTTEGYESFLRRVQDEVKAVEKRAQQVSAEISSRAEQQLVQSVDDFRQNLLEGGNALKRLSEELLEFLQNNLNAEYSARREDLEELRRSAATESSRLRHEIEGLEARIATLNESARSLESGLDKRLGQMSSNVIRDAREHLESTVIQVLEQLTASCAKTSEVQVAEASKDMGTTRNDMLVSFSGSLSTESAKSLHAFEHSIEEAAKQSVERWRLKLVGNLNALAKNLGEPF
jgi:prefoldin subunit 5